jgi:hypothetical protein
LVIVDPRTRDAIRRIQRSAARRTLLKAHGSSLKVYRYPMDNRFPDEPPLPPPEREPERDPEPPWPPAGTGKWLLGTFLVTVAILLVQLYPYRFAAGAPPFLGLRHAGALAVLGQVALFVPLGIVEARLARLALGFAGGALALLVAIDAALLSLICQTAQYWLPDRTSSVIDLAANTLGGVLGYKLSLLLSRDRR